MDKYMVQTRALARSSGIKLPEVHGAKKELIPHEKLENSMQSEHPIPPTCHLRPIHHTPSAHQAPPTNAILPMRKPRVGQGRAGIKRKPRIEPPITKIIQTPAPPMSIPKQR